MLVNAVVSSIALVMQKKVSWLGVLMPPLPHGERAVIEDSKFVGYALNPHSERGRHKARVFAQVLGFNLSNWDS